MNSKRWKVRVTRTLQDKEVGIFHLGPHRFLLWARAVAWLETSSGYPFRQTAEVLASGEAMQSVQDGFGG